MLVFTLIMTGICGCVSQEKIPPPQSIPGPSIIDLEDIAASSSGIVLTDSTGRDVTVPRNISHVLCFGPGCMRYLAYLKATDMASGADAIERDTQSLLPLTYLIADPGIRTLPPFEKEPGIEDPALIAELSQKPDLIIRMGDNHHIAADELQRITGIPVLVLHEGDLGYGRSTMNYALRVMGVVLGKSERADEVIRFFDKVTDNLQTRTWTIPDFQLKSAYLGGYSGPEPQGLFATTSVYIPFNLVKVKKIGEEYANQNALTGQYFIPKEALSRMAPDAVFIDMTTWARKENAISDLEKSEILEGIPAVRNGEVYGLLPTALYGEEHESDLINAYVIGKALYPEKFTDVDPRIMADYIHAFLYGEPLYEELNRGMGGMVLSRIPLFT